ncbi:Repeat domain-containing protein [Roseivivax halotolerans]|uniref:Repeat domain-containing protein n=1 Tax=Roseivivax halotolerans TaxID=93684 RepID=A0A1I5YR15_9RHOB|nr:VCBS repeat-containing protein [Roseivivax halotolerans]SFQ46530.1 Repeat domain-containing protein [Roseivivax halotolerans]
MRTILAVALIASPAFGEPRFERIDTPLDDHVYSGGWEHFVGGGVAVFDCNDDRLPELFAAGGETPAALFLNEGGMQFAKGDLPELTGVTGAYPLHLDDDAEIDLYVMRVGPDLALLGDGDCAFRDGTEEIGLPQTDQWTTAFTAWFEPGEDRPTLAVGHYVDRSDPDGPFEVCDANAILRPGPNGYEAEELTPGFCPLSMLAAKDWRREPTLRISNDRHYYVRGGAEQMWDIGERRFLTEADGWDGPQLWGMGIAARDLTGDGRAEVMLTSMGDQLLQIAGRDGYKAAPFEIGTYAQRPFTGGDGRPSTGWHAEFGDVNNDRLDDLFIAKGNVDQMPGMAMDDPNNLLMQEEDGTFVEHGESAGIATLDRARGAALSDLDFDGRLDLVVVNRRAGMELYRNVTEETGNWIAIDLVQPGPNPGAVGAEVRVNGRLQEVTVGGGHAGGDAGPLHWGLGDAGSARVEITWPDGTQAGPLRLRLNGLHRLVRE